MTLRLSLGVCNQVENKYSQINYIYPRFDQRTSRNGHSGQQAKNLPNTNYFSFAKLKYYRSIIKKIVVQIIVKNSKSLNRNFFSYKILIPLS